MGKSNKVAHAHSVGRKLAYVYSLSMLYTSTCVQGKAILAHLSSTRRKRQVIMVTHNPQFIVNLDVDNVIFLSKKDNHFFVQSGALEYEDDEYGILDIVARNIDGGLDTIRKRMKRYDKEV